MFSSFGKGNIFVCARYFFFVFKYAVSRAENNSRDTFHVSGDRNCFYRGVALCKMKRAMKNKRKTQFK